MTRVQRRFLQLIVTMTNLSQWCADSTFDLSKWVYVCSLQFPLGENVTLMFYRVIFTVYRTSLSVKGLPLV